MSTLSQKSATVAVSRRFCDSVTFLRQCGQGLSHTHKVYSQTSAEVYDKNNKTRLKSESH